MNWLSRSSSFWSDIDPFGDADLWGIGFAAIAAVLGLIVGDRHSYMTVIRASRLDPLL